MKIKDVYDQVKDDTPLEVQKLKDDLNAIVKSFDEDAGAKKALEE